MGLGREINTGAFIVEGLTRIYLRIYPWDSGVRESGLKNLGSYTSNGIGAKGTEKLDLCWRALAKSWTEHFMGLGSWDIWAQK